MNKKKIQSEQTKKRVADAARNLFANKGYKATSIEDIVEATGSSKGNIYYHFKSKEGLFLYLLDEWDKEWEQKWVEKESLYKTTKEKLFGMAEQMVLDDLNHPLTKAADEFFNNEEKTGEIEERIAEMVMGHLKFNQKLIQQGIDSGEFRKEDVESLAIILESLLIGLSQMSRKSTVEEALTLYKLAFNVFLFGISTSSNR
ncbi:MULTISPECIES: TetR/AcrR family transcriptional regulator [Heyndrickxia]|uniref:TetR family transcriptional regulator C-terminal domain-containing protein n=1 Tax=Heyndrickxia oleronia TaxID=38875 RepID=A0AAW6SQ10_9BACI|nr:TetR/AcrR family transcriptional regulator [Heyndrickxia oleronia]MCI1613428.1 TetR/AcrR family transcriptional regulator [Heyndrickxia oleronia]MCI1744664.1 TetR/AcrR family transcriptional regulator [Heyndrickxia oleronia]MCI1761377.1 TetR/AcrR family transcriptional regulator [Heyndrickxia oleronia]MCM3239243.1 TetR/AcrR family transcriptional regulator [Heyndrickxia oleronia]MDH5160916.1 TetR family transcriptional regulator C-terminal domain-containing protein [Heyndrickxia oleronia]